ncbi:hypothetical protein ACFX13_023060 [Malus domestica]
MEAAITKKDALSPRTVTTAPPSTVVGPSCKDGCSKGKEVEVFSKLTNAYSLVSIGGFKNFYNTFEAELANVILVVKTSIGGTRIISRLCTGNKNGLFLPHST